MTFLTTNGVQSYARAVREALGDLPPEQAHAVLDGLDEHLGEIVAEGTVDLEAVLGSPESYAAELRASAGLPASTRRTWAAPPADLRSDVPTSDVASEEAEPLARPRGFGRLAAPLLRKFASRGVTLPRAFLAGVYGLLLVYLIRSSRPLNIFEIAFGALLVVGAWRLLRATIARAELPAHWVTYAPRVLGGTVILLALILGGRIGSSGTRYVYVDNASPFPPGSTTFATIASIPMEGQSPVPNMIGTSLAETTETLSRFRFTTVVEGGQTDLSTRLITTRMDPAPGTLVDNGSAVKVYVAPVSSLIPTSTVAPVKVITSTTVTSSAATLAPVTPTTAAIPPGAASSVTTVAPEVVTTVPVVTTTATTTVPTAVPATLDPTSAPASTVTK
jgi:hypothetical protein